MTVADSINGTDADDDTKHSTAAYIPVREDASTGSSPQMTTASENNQILTSGTWKNGINGTDADDDTEHSTAAYIPVREDASTGSSPQMTAKHIFPRLPFGIYIHWPYCLSKCPYCDFFSKVQKTVEQEKIIDGYLNELDFYHRIYPMEKVGSIFFGGGTPSLLKPELIEKIINHIDKLWGINNNAEISLEANPNTDNGTLFRSLKNAGINRLSLGVQALNETDLKFLGRTHNLKQALKSIENVLQTFDNHSMDLIYARPHQHTENWIKELNTAASFGFKHLSLYQLTIEDGTVFARKGIKTPDEKETTEMFIQTENFMEKNGYIHYEISNYAHPGFESRHNLLYWQGDNYVGIGPAAHGRLKTKEKIYASEYCCRLEELSPEERAEELLITGLRLKKGINKKHFQKQCGISLNRIISAEKLKEISALGLLRENKKTLRLTSGGFLLMNKIIEELIC